MPWQGSNSGGHPQHCRVMSDRTPITRVDAGTCMVSKNASHSYISFRSRDLAFLFHRRRQFDMAPRDLHPACQGMGYLSSIAGIILSCHVQASLCVAQSEQWLSI